MASRLTVDLKDRFNRELSEARFGFGGGGQLRFQRPRTGATVATVMRRETVRYVT